MVSIGISQTQDLWNIGLVHKNKKNYDEAAPMLDQAKVEGPSFTGTHTPRCGFWDGQSPSC